ncbi:MAG: asparagine synthase (glutamine-hydrolyzing) [Fluviibacter sp.]
MCGIVGFVSQIGFANCAQSLSSALLSMNHRGPDASAYWLDAAAGTGLGHVRLSILDLSEAGAQPMVSVSGRYVIVFNGEIYNHLEIRQVLNESGAMINWHGHSDTETLLAAINRWGFQQTLERCVGMFAIALWDKQDQMLSLVRDRFGEKPLYYSLQNGVFSFASELKALRKIHQFDASVEPDALSLLLHDGYISAPYTIYKDVFKLLPGHALSITQDDIAAQRLPVVYPYWTLESAVARGIETPFGGSVQDAVAGLTDHLKQAVHSQMLSDVPLGAFLSGGVDSSLIVSLMQSQSISPVKTFSMGFSDPAYDESKYAREVAQYLGTEHTEWIVSAEEALAVIPHLPKIYDEPFADVSAIPTCILSRVAREKVSVSLSGDAGDELFAGYNRYLGAAKTWNRLSKVPRGARQLFSTAVLALEPTIWDTFANKLNYCVPKRMQYKAVGNKLHRLAKAVQAHNPSEFYEYLTAKWRDPKSVLNQGQLPAARGAQLMAKDDVLSVEAMMLADTVQYLPDDILVKVDRASMAASLEARVPMLDHRLVEFAWSLPMSMKVHAGTGKWILKEVLNQYLPKGLIDRPKMGFDVPVDRWLRGPLREWGEAMLDQRVLEEQGFFDARIVRSLWEAHVSGQKSYHHELWPILMFQAWHKEWMQ